MRFPKRAIFILLLLILGGAALVLRNTGSPTPIIASGVVSLAPTLDVQAKGIRTLFLTVFDAADPKPMPYGAIRYKLDDDARGEFHSFTLTPDNLRAMQPGSPVPAQLRIKARLDTTGQGGAVLEEFPSIKSLRTHRSLLRRVEPSGNASRRSRVYAGRGLDRSRLRRALVSVDDLAAGRKPDLIPLLDVGECALEIFDPQRLTSDHRMQRNAHHSRLLRAVGV